VAYSEAEEYLAQQEFPQDDLDTTMQNKVRESKECMQITYDSKEQPLGKGFIFDPKFKQIASDSII